MHVFELRDPDLARRAMVQGLWLARAAPAGERLAQSALAWAYEIAAAGAPLPPVGFVADVAQAALGRDEGGAVAPPHVPGFDAGLAREYEDYVLARLYADHAFQRGADALARYRGRDRQRGLAFLVAQLGARVGLGGASLSPSVVKALQQRPPEEVLAEGWESIRRDGLLAWLPAEYARIVAGIRNTGDLVGSEDVFELEHGTALAEFSRRVALRQVLQAAAALGAGLPQHKPRRRGRRQQAATPLVQEDTYPVGGFASIANRGSMESLLHSQLAYLEREDRPDLFDVKYVRDELLYYARDENQFFRRRQTFLFGLAPDLVRARFKDAAAPYQRIVLAMGAIVAAVERLAEWLSEDGLRFELVLLDAADQCLEAERAVLDMVFRGRIAGGTAALERTTPEDFARRCGQAARRGMCHGLVVSAGRPETGPGAAGAARLDLARVRPALVVDGEAAPVEEAEDVLGAWGLALRGLLAAWMDASLG